LSRKATKRLAELQGRECYFFTSDFQNRYIPAEEQTGRDVFWTAFDIPNPNEVLNSQVNWNEMTDAQKKASGESYDKHSISNRPDDRADKLLIQVVEELGSERASGGCAELKIVEIPDGVDYEISEYDGNEHIAEKHCTWS